jgi:periplasmic protein TonB
MIQPLNHVVGVVGLVAVLGISAAGFQEGPVYQVGDPGVTSPRVVKEVRPTYSPEAMKAKVQGEVVLKTIVNQKGEPTDIRVVRSLEESLDKEAVKALSRWVFAPGRRNGDPVRVEVEVMLTFKIS